MTTKSGAITLPKAIGSAAVALFFALFQYMRADFWWGRGNPALAIWCFLGVAINTLLFLSCILYIWSIKRGRSTQPSFLASAIRGFFDDAPDSVLLLLGGSLFFAGVIGYATSENFTLQLASIPVGIVGAIILKRTFSLKEK